MVYPWRGEIIVRHKDGCDVIRSFGEHRRSSKQQLVVWNTIHQEEINKRTRDAGQALFFGIVMGLIGNVSEQKVENLSICGHSSPWESGQPATTQCGNMFEMISPWIRINAEEDFWIRKPGKVEEAFLRRSGSFIVDSDGSSWGFSHYIGRHGQIGDPDIGENLQRAEDAHICMDGWVSNGSG